LILLFSLVACFDYQPPPPPPPPGVRPPAEEISLIPPGGAVDVRPSNSAARITEVDIQPRKASARDDLLASSTVSDRDDQDVQVRYTWILNGQERPDLTGPSLERRHIKKGDRVAVKVTADDGEDQVEERSGELTILNSPPEFVGDPRLAASIEGTVVKAEDFDGDEIRFRMEGAPAGMSIDPRLGRIAYQGSETEKGGDYEVSVIADDGDGGTAVWTFKVAISPGMTAEEAKAKALAEREAARAAGTP
jgi:hypothetical protein